MTDSSNTLWVQIFISCCFSSTPFLLLNSAIHCHCAVLLSNWAIHCYCAVLLSNWTIHCHCAILLSNWAIHCHCAVSLCRNKPLLLFRVSATGNLHGHVHGWVWDNNKVTRILLPLPVAVPRCTAASPGWDRRCSRTRQAAITEWQTKVSAIF